MAAGRLIVAAAAAAALALAGCGEEENPAFSKQVREQMDEFAAARKAKVERLIDEGVLPPVARRVLDFDGTLNVNFIDGPNGDEDVVRTRNGGTSGPKLQWDLDGNGRIDRDERTITERELYDATLGLPSG